MNFNEEKDQILKNISMSKNRTEYEGKFFRFLEMIIVDMMKEEDNFFGYFMVGVKREINNNINWPIETIPLNNGFKMYFNIKLFIDNNKREMKAIIKHEIYHIMYGHFKRERILREKYSILAVNLALDISINSFIKNLPPYYKRLHWVNLTYNLELKENMPCEYYAERLDNYFKEKGSKESIITKLDKNHINIENAHSWWWKSNISQEIIDNISKNTAEKSYRGKAPKEIESIILSYNKIAQLSWQQILKRLIPSLRVGSKKTITRRDRRQPDRIDIKGKLTDSAVNIVVAIDISASMSDEDYNSIIIEILNIVKTRDNKITIIECDNEIRRVYEIKTIKDIKKRKNKNGSTAFTPVFKYLKENNLKDVILIYFTDGVGEKVLEVQPINRNIIWVLTGEEELSLKAVKGVVKRISSNKEKGEGGTSGLDMLQNAINDIRII